MSSSGTLPATVTDRSATTLMVDNLLRRVLKVSDPGNPDEISRALLDRYGDQAVALRNERTGFPVVARAEAAPPTSVAAVSFGPEVAQAMDDLERDIRSLTENSQLKDVRAELGGWARSIRSTATDGLGAARFSLDPRQRDRALAARRQLGDFARLSRYAGALTADVGPLYRKLAQSCDILAGLMLVLIGDGLAAGGITRGTLILNVSPSDLLERRDAAVMALRTLVGVSNQSYGPNDWPRGIEAYRRLLDQLDASGMAELRGLFHEQTLARTLDEVIDLASSTTPDGLRAMGSPATVTALRLQRLIAVAQAALANANTGTRRLVPESPPLAAFLSALALFAQAFDAQGSMSRLLYIARPPIIFYGLFGQGGPDLATRRLLELVQLRGRLAEQADCFLECRCDDVRCQLMLDKILFDVDRAIDLYALGNHPLALGDPERRAAAYGALIQVFTAFNSGPRPPAANQPVPCLPDTPEAEELRTVLLDLLEQLGWPDVITNLAAANRPRVARLLHGELCLQRAAEARWVRLVETLAPACRRGLLESETFIEENLNLAVAEIQNVSGVVLGECPPFDLNIPPQLETSLDTIANDMLADGR